MKEVIQLSQVQLLIGTLLCSGLVVILPGFNPITILIWGAAFLITGLYVDKKNVLLIFAFNIVLMYVLLADVAYIAFSLVSIGLPSLIMGLLLAQAKDYYAVRKAGMISALVGVTLMLGMIWLQGYTLEATMTEQIAGNIRMEMEQYLTAGVFDRYLQQGLTFEELSAMADTTGVWVATYFPALKYIQSIISVFIILSLAVAWARFKRMAILLKRPYVWEHMPWQFSWLVILGLALWYFDLSSMGVIGANIVFIMAVICLYYGNAVLLYHYQFAFSPKRRRWVFMAFLMFTLFLPQIVIMFAMIIGLFDSLVDFRNLKKEKKA